MFVVQGWGKEGTKAISRVRESSREVKEDSRREELVP